VATTGTTPGITLTDDISSGAGGLVTTSGNQTATRIWQSAADTDAFRREIVEATRTVVDGYRSHYERACELRECGLTEHDGLLADVFASLADPNTDQFWEALRLCKQFGTGKPSVLGFRFSLEELVGGPLAIFRASGTAPTIVVEVDERFGNLRAEQQKEVCELLRRLATTFDVRVVGSGLRLRWLVGIFDEELGVDVSDLNITTPVDSVVAEATGDAIDTAREEFGTGSREVRILRWLYDEPTQTMSYGAIRSQSSVGRSRVNQCVKALEKKSMITIDSTGAGENVAELLPAGQTFVEQLDEEIGRQQRFDAGVNEAPNPFVYSRVKPTPPQEGDGEGRDRDGHRSGDAAADEAAIESESADGRPSGSVFDAPLQGWNALAASACATEGEVALVDHPIEKYDDFRIPFRWHDSATDRLVVGGEYRNCMQYAVCIARALASPYVRENALTPERLEGSDGDAMIGSLLTDAPHVLRGTACLGNLKDADATGEGYWDALQEAESELCELSRRWRCGEYSCSDEAFRRTVIKNALGLATTLAHLCELCGLSLVRELRMPRFNSNIEPHETAYTGLIEHIGNIVAKQSMIGLYSAYRQLYEQRPDKQQSAFSMSIDDDDDNDDPHGSFVGSLVVIGPKATRLADDLQSELRSPGDLREDAPDCGVRVHLAKDAGCSTEAYARTILCMARKKDKEIDSETLQEASARLNDLTGSPYDAARGLDRLASGNGPREEGSGPSLLRLDEFDYVLTKIDPRRIKPDMRKPAKSKIIQALLTSTDYHTNAELARRAGVSPDSVREHIDDIVAEGYVDRIEPAHPDVVDFGTVFIGEYPTYDAPGLGTQVAVSSGVRADAIVARTTDDYASDGHDPPPTDAQTRVPIRFGNRPNRTAGGQVAQGTLAGPKGGVAGG
jgi:DNA-binding MarR family transcriptional regulator